MAQQTPAGTDSQQQTIQILMERVEKLEARVAQLEAARQTSPAVASAPALAPATATAASPEASGTQAETSAGPVESSETERMDPSRTLLRMRGFGDITFHGDNGKDTNGNPDHTAFTLGQLDLFVTSDVSEKFHFLSEIVFEADQTNNFGVDVERLLLQYSHNDYFNVSVGRYHTAIGWYNTAYHHSTWLQTATGRPFLFAFEDQGGILPVHNVGVSITGLVPSGKLGLHYIAELGNGRAWARDAEAVQNVVDDRNGKAVNLGLFARPAKVPGLQVGFSVYHDKLLPTRVPISETIVAAHAVMVRPNFEWLNEALVIRHAPQGMTHVYETPGFYTQISKRIGSFRPYVRYQYVNASDSEPIFGTLTQPVGLRQGPSAGLRYDASESVAFKVQYDYTDFRHVQAVNGLAMQLGFTF
jgi:hypothetical protein